MLTRKFTYAEHKEFGFMGWKPDWLKGQVDPLEAMGAAHDILEHIIDKQGGAEGEMLAFGAALYGRAQSGYFRNGQPSDNLASDFRDILPRIFNSDESMTDPGRTHRLDDEWLEGEIQDTIRKGFRLTLEEVYDDVGWPWPRSADSLSIPELKRRMAGWIRKGYRAAARYYSRYDLDGYSVGYLFRKVQDEIDRVSRVADVGMVLTVKIDLKRADVRAFCEYPDEDDYY